MSRPYEAKFRVGSEVRIKSTEQLALFKDTWKHHNPLSDDQLKYAGSVSKVNVVGFYHGGDPLYELEGVPGVWHEDCLAPPNAIIP